MLKVLGGLCRNIGGQSSERRSAIKPGSRQHAPTDVTSKFLGLIFTSKQHEPKFTEFTPLQLTTAGSSITVGA